MALMVCEIIEIETAAHVCDRSKRWIRDEVVLPPLSSNLGHTLLF